MVSDGTGSAATFGQSRRTYWLHRPSWMQALFWEPYGAYRGWLLKVLRDPSWWDPSAPQALASRPLEDLQVTDPGVPHSRVVARPLEMGVSSTLDPLATPSAK